MIFLGEGMCVLLIKLLMFIKFPPVRFLFFVMMFTYDVYFQTVPTFVFRRLKPTGPTLLSVLALPVFGIGRCPFRFPFVALQSECVLGLIDLALIEQIYM